MMRISVTAALAVALSVVPCALAQSPDSAKPAVTEVPLDVKGGAWEATITQIVMPEESVLAQMPPDQRAMMEAQARASGVPQTSPQCQAQEDLGKSIVADFLQPGCTAEIAESTPQKLRASVSCPGERPRLTTIEADAPTPEAVSMMVDASEKGGARTIITISGVFKSETCPAP